MHAVRLLSYLHSSGRFSFVGFRSPKTCRLLAPIALPSPLHSIAPDACGSIRVGRGAPLWRACGRHSHDGSSAHLTVWFGSVAVDAAAAVG